MKVIATVGFLSALFIGATQASPIDTGALEHLEERVTPPCDTFDTFTIVSESDTSPGDGDPHQNYYHVQLSQNQECGEGSCSVGQTQTHSVTVGWSLGIPGGPDIKDWITGGFSVSESWTTGNTYTCDGSAGQIVCVYQSVAHTAYTVDSQEVTCTGSVENDVNILRSPNSDNLGGGFYCAYGTACVDEGNSFWNNGCAGGPQGNCDSGTAL